MKNKRASHVGMILSFVIFITFIVFLYSVVQPALDTGEDKKSILGTIELEIIKNVSLNLTTASVQIASNENPNKECVVFANLLTALSITTPYAVVVQNETGNPQIAYAGSSSIAGEFGGIKVNKRSKKDNNYNSFFNIYSSNNFSGLKTNDGLTTCEILSYDIGTNSGDYIIGSVRKDKYAFEDKIKYLMNHYNSNYEQLKGFLKIPPGNDFGFGFTNSSGAKVEVGTAPKTASVFADDVPVQYVTKNASILSGFINIKVW